MSAQQLLTQTSMWVLLLTIAAAAGFVALVRQGPRQYRFKAQPVMTPNEVEFYGRLSRALPDCFVFPQVAMSALVAPRAMGKNARLAAFRSVSQKRVDYALLAKDFSLVCVVELDDRTHDKRRDARRDAYLASAGIKTVRWQSRGKPSEALIRQTVLSLARQGV